MHHKSSPIKRRAFYVAIIALSAAISLVVGELIVRLFSPAPYMYPRYKYSQKYRFTLFENTRMEHGFPGKFKFHYTINEHGYRGRPVAFNNDGSRRNVVVLGDSYTFGMGVNDGEEYPAVLGDILGERYGVVNLGNPGWGLTQEIRKYYDFGNRFHPEFVVLQFCSNDPDNNLTHRVTTIEDGEFTFHDGGAGIHWAKKYLSKSPIQKVQLYNFFRVRAFHMYQKRITKDGTGTADPKAREKLLRKERFYSDLLTLFATKLSEEGVTLIVLSVDHHLERFPNVKENVERLHAEGTIHYVETIDLIAQLTAPRSHEGHWSPMTHKAIAGELGSYILGTEKAY